jgi:hypothetical protein
MNKQHIIEKLNETDNYKNMRFESVAHDGRNTLLRRKCGKGYMLINRFENWEDERENGDKPIYSDNVDGWDNGR